MRSTLLQREISSTNSYHGLSLWSEATVQCARVPPISIFVESSNAKIHAAYHLVGGRIHTATFYSLPKLLHPSPDFCGPGIFMPSSLRQRFGSSYLRLLLGYGPTTLDVFLITIGLLFAVAAGLPFPLLGILFGQLLDDINSVGCSESGRSQLDTAITSKIIYMVYVTIFNFVSLYIHTCCWSLVGERLVRRLREKYFKSLLRQEIEFFDGLPSGEVCSRLSVDLETIQTGTSEKVGICITSISYFVAAYTVAFLKNARLAGILVCLVPAYFIMGVGGGYLVKKYSSRLSIHSTAAMSIVADSLANMPIVHAFGSHQRLEGIFMEHLRKGQIYGLQRSIAAAGQLGLLYLISFSANALAFWQGSQEIADSLSSQGTGATVGAVYTVIFLLVDGKSNILWFCLLLSEVTEK